MKGVFVTGTNTDAGKTWVGCRILNEFRQRKLTVKVRKPVESGWPATSDISSTDAWKLAEAIDQTNNLDSICPHRFTAAISPDRAAMLEGSSLTIKQLNKDCVKGVNEDDFLYIEGAGGFYSPLCSDGLNADLAAAVQLPILLVVENRLGCINQALLNVEAIHNRGLQLAAIALNKVDDIKMDQAMDNLADIKKRVECDVIQIGFNQTSTIAIQRLVAILNKNQVT